MKQGGALTIEGGSLSGGSVHGGAAGSGQADGGSGYGTGIFLQGRAAITLAPLSGQTLSLGDALTDQSIAGGTQPAVTVHGPGTVVAAGTADITVGRLEVASGGSLIVEGVTVTTDPTTIDAGGFSGGFRDLLLSPGHAVFAEGVLIPVCRLVNGASVVQERPGTVTYYHVEVVPHDVLLAEGLAVESYLDDGNRAEFENGGQQMVLHPEFTAQSWDNACAPKRESGVEVVAVKRRLRERLASLGYRLATDGRLDVMMGRRRLAPRFARGRVQHVVLPAGAEELRLVSPHGIPAWLDEASDDQRPLGGRVELVLLDGERVPLDDAAFASGFHGIEHDAGGSWRWTDGDARLRFPPANEKRLLELFVGDIMRRWEPAETLRLTG